jgi:hypothetical protein
MCAFLAVCLCLAPISAMAAKKKGTSTKKTKPPPVAAAESAPKAEVVKPLPEPGAVTEIPRDQVSPEGIWYQESGGKSQAVRLPASIDFREGNLFQAEGRWIRVTHLSKNTREPAFKMGRREKYFHDNSLYPQEESLLDYARLHLFPKPGALGPRPAVEAWMADLDSFLALHRNDPTVIRDVQAFVLKFANQPPRGYLPGDQLWDTKRRFATWIQFFEHPFQYDMSGTALMVDGKPLESIPLFVSKEKIAGLPKLYPYVLRNLEYTFEALRTVMLEGSEVKNDDGLAEISAIRRSYLTLKLLKTGHELWERMNESQ